ncbi:MAG: GNAT family N-acetyltransferase [Oscillospiraceae bacterium]|jgi:predicted N-acetyltransferase YhbS
MTLRTFTEKDSESLSLLEQEAFASSDDVTLDFSEYMRKNNRYLPELDLVAEEDGGICGHVLVTAQPMACPSGEIEVLYLAPLFVIEKLRGRGIGSALVKEVLHRCSDLGYGAVFAVGDPGYYGRFGFHPASEFGFCAGEELSGSMLLALELLPGYFNKLHETKNGE